MAQSTICIRMDGNLKNEFDNVCRELGLNMTTAITMLAKKMAREKRLPFDVALDPFYSEENMNALKESIEQMKQGRVVAMDISDLKDE